jgi:NitT/TauT family transport system substrate-binding protein
VFGDPSPGNRLIQQANPDMTDDIIANAIAQMRSRNMVRSEDTKTLGIGAMTPQRWQSFFETMSQSGVYDKDLDWQSAFTTRFINKGEVQ